MADRIELRDLEVYAHHGVLDHERALGQRFLLDVALELDLAAAGSSDALGDTVDYGALSARVAAQVRDERHQLIETVAERVAAACLDHDPRVTAVEVTVRKPAAPMPVAVREVAVRVRRERP